MPRSVPRSLFPLLLASACGDTADSGSFALPDITGGYQIFLDGVSSSNLCEEENHYVTDWLRGTLQITGERPDDVTFTFSDGMSFHGGVDGSWSYWFGGDATWDIAWLDVSHHGTFGSEGGSRTLGGTFEVTVDDDEFTTNNCIIEVGITGTRISD
jgi:hypothetical protein